MKIRIGNLIQVVTYAVDESQKGLVVSAGVVRDSSKVKVLFQVSRWGDQLTREIEAAHQRHQIDQQNLILFSEN